MYLVVAKVMNTTKTELEACRVFDTVTKEMKLLSLRRIKKAISNGVTVVGFRVTKVSDFNKGSIRDNIVKEHGKFTFARVTELNGNEELVNTGNAKFYTVYGWKGFAEAKQYYCVNYKGEEKMFRVDEFEEAVRKGIINGASINSHTDKPVIHEALGNELD